MKNTVLLLLLSLSLSAVNVGEIPKEVILNNNNGGLAKDGSAWSSKSIRGKVYLLLYVDPDKKDENSRLLEAFDNKNFDTQKVGQIAIVNLNATWKPNYIIEKLLSSKQKESPNITYVKDKKSVLVKEWNLADDASNVLIFSKKGELLFYKDGALSDDEIKEAMNIIEKNLEWLRDEKYFSLIS